MVEIDRFSKVEEASQPRYKGYHIGAERNDRDKATGAKIIDNAKHIDHLRADQRDSVRMRVEQHLPFLLAQLDSRARSIVNLAELKKYCEMHEWQEPTGPTLTATHDGKSLNPEPFYGKKVELRPHPPAEVVPSFRTVL